MRRLSVIMILSVAFFSKAAAQDSSFYKQNAVAIPFKDNGNNLLLELNKADSIFDFNIAVAAFAPGRRLAWHYHPGGQILIISEGTGYYQERGKPKQIVHKGDVIKAMPGVEHWHGASAETGVSYIATYTSSKGATVWQEKVSDADYAK